VQLDKEPTDAFVRGRLLLTKQPSMPLAQITKCAILVALIGTSRACLPVDARVGTCLTVEEADLARLVNEYRQSLSPPLPPLPISRTLTKVAQRHARDTVPNSPDALHWRCNQHSWSATCPDTWRPLCFTASPKSTQSMWSKPREFNPAFQHDGYGISTKIFRLPSRSSKVVHLTPAGAMSSWKSSPPHDEVLTRSAAWHSAAHPDFQPFGVGMYEGRAHAWFSYGSDPAGSVPLCPR
jgi:hypothetical protein